MNVQLDHIAAILMPNVGTQLDRMSVIAIPVIQEMDETAQVLL